MNQSYIEHTGQIIDHLNWFATNSAMTKINTETFKTAAQLTNIPLTELAEFLQVSRPKLYQPSATIDKKIRERLIELVMISDLAFQLHKADKSKTIIWIMSPNHLFFGRSPFEKALAGEAKSVIHKLQDMIG
jgi:hypothetical protein